jgi:membrane-bound metal-dependent hydrolase YbcI (DUF457 family)
MGDKRILAVLAFSRLTSVTIESGGPHPHLQERRSRHINKKSPGSPLQERPVKGIAHFVSGIAVATFFPDAVRQAADGSFLLVLGGLFGLLPDTLDFRFTRFLESRQLEIDPHPESLDPRAIADQLANAMRAAFERGRPITVQLHTVRVDVDRWRAYSLRFIPESGAIAVRVGPLVDTSGVALPRSSPTGEVEAFASTGVPMLDTYDRQIDVDIFSGPSFRFQRQGDALHVVFLPWHRRWSHSLTLVVFVGLTLGLLLGPTVGCISGLGLLAHVLEDQLGYMGANLLWPFSRRRSRGLALLRSGDPLPNFLTVWLAVGLILFNLDRFAPAPRLPTIPYLVALLLPVALLLGRSRIRSQGKADQSSAEALRQGELLDEIEEIEIS